MPALLDTYIENRHRVQPNHANNYGTVHGGNVMKWMDEVGAMSAIRFSGEYCVTASVDNLSFERPVPVGETVFIRSYVYDAGQTSAKVRLKTFREDPKDGTRERTTESYFVFVAIDEDGKPTEVPELTVETERGQKLREAALEGESEECRTFGEDEG